MTLVSIVSVKCMVSAVSEKKSLPGAMVDAKTKLKKIPSARYLYFKIPGRTRPLYIHHDNNKVQTRASWGGWGVPKIRRAMAQIWSD